MTQVLKIDPGRPDGDSLELAGRAVAEGQVVVFPTDTVYAIGANLFDQQALSRVFKAKARPENKGLIAMVSEPGQLEVLADSASRVMTCLADKFWPGPLTLVIHADARVPGLAAVRGMIGVRMPDSPVALRMLRSAGLPAATSSANRSGESPTNQPATFGRSVGANVVVDAGPCGSGVPSTIVMVKGEAFWIIRPGPIGQKEIEEALEAC